MTSLGGAHFDAIAKSAGGIVDSATICPAGSVLHTYSLNGVATKGRPALAPGKVNRRTLELQIWELQICKKSAPEAGSA